MKRFVKLDFRLVEYEDDENTIKTEIRFEGHDGWQNINFYKQS